jgi:hypothetical protein
MAKTRNTDMPEHHAQHGHYGELSLDLLPSGSSGDIFYYSGSNWARLPIGTNGDVLTIVSGLPQWVASLLGSPYTPQ